MTTTAQPPTVEHATMERPAGALALASEQTFWTPEQRAALVQLGLNETPNADLAVFLHQCQRTSLDPFTRQIYMIGRWDKRLGREKYTIQTAIDGFRVIAERHGKYAGQDGPYWCGPDGQWTDVWTSTEPPAAAKVGIIRHDWLKPVYGIALYGEYCPTNRDGQPETMWRRMPAGMLAKCAEALGFRKAFPQDMSGIYTSEEMARADQVDLPPTVVEAPAEAPVQNATPPAHRHPAEPAPTTVDAPADEQAAPKTSKPIGEDQTRTILTLFSKLQVTDRAARQALVAELVGRADATAYNMTSTEAATLITKLTQRATDDTRPASKGLLTQIHTLLGGLGVTTRSVKLMVCNVLANRPDDDPLMTTDDLTLTQAKRVVTELTGEGAQELVNAIIAAGKATAV